MDILIEELERRVFAILEEKANMPHMMIYYIADDNVSLSDDKLFFKPTVASISLKFKLYPRKTFKHPNDRYYLTEESKNFIRTHPNYLSILRSLGRDFISAGILC